MTNQNELERKIIVKSKRNILKIIKIVFWLCIIISLIFSIKNAFAEIDEMGGWNIVREQYSSSDLFFKIGIYFLLNVVLNNLFIIVVYIAIKLAINKYTKERLSNIDLKNYEGYFRDILKQYSPAELSYIDDFELSYKEDIVATLLSLRLKGAISFDENNEVINVISNSIEDLSQNEKYILSGIKNGKLVEYNDEAFKSKVIEDSLRNDLLKDITIKNAKIVKSIIGIIFSFPIFTIITILITIAMFNNSSAFNVEVFIIFFIFVFILLFFFPIGLLAFLITYIIKNVKNKYARSKNGELVNEKIEGLKNYLNDYSSLDEKEKESITIWEDYLLYSVIFKHNNNIVKDILNKYVNIV